jgi:microcystin-dependent protein
MARNGSGTYSIPVTMTAGTSATAADQNTNFSDIATALTQSLAVDGQTPMTGQLPLSVGSLAAPGLAFSGDLDTGIYHPSANQVGIVAGGVLQATASATGLAVATGISGTGTIPVGMPAPWFTATPPTGWLLCAGQTVSRTTYAALFAVLGTAYNVGGEASDVFRLPDPRGCTFTGLDNIGGSDAARLSKAGANRLTLGAVVGADAVTLAISEVPSHDHGGTTSTVAAHGHGYQAAIYNSIFVTGGSGTGATSNTAVSTDAANSHNHTITAQGGGTSHLNVQPSFMVNVIIYTGVFS